MTQFEITDGVLLGYNGADAEIVIPDGVVTIGYEAFYQNKDIVKVTIPDSAMIISQNAFSFCENLREVELPSSLFFIGDGAFNYCKSLESISIPDTVAYLGDSAFMNCESLVSINLSANLERLEDGVLCGCESLPSVEIPSSVRIIGDNAFTRCRSLTSVDIPFGVEIIGGSAFALCNSLRYVSIPDSVHVIGGMAFYKCDELEQVRLPSSVFYIGYNAFPNSTRYSMRRYGYIQECQTADPRLSARTLSQSEMAHARAMGFDVDERGVLFEYRGQDARVAVPDYVKAIAEEAFNSNSVVEEVTLPFSVEYLGRHAFAHSVNLRKVVFECEKAQLGRNVFSDCISLESVVLPAGLEEISENTFWGCKSLKDIDLPNALRVVGSHAFFECSALTSVELPDQLLCVKMDAFVNCENLVSVVFPESVCHLGFRCFTECPELKKVSIPSRVFVHGEGLCQFDKGVDVGKFDTQWTPKPKFRIATEAPKGRQRAFENVDHKNAGGNEGLAKPSAYSSLMKTIAFVAQAASNASSLMGDVGLHDMERMVSDVEYDLDACGQMLYSVLIEKGFPFLQSGVHSRSAFADAQPFSYREYKRAFADNALIPYDAKIGEVVNLLNTHLATAFQEAVIAFQYALSSDEQSVEVFKGRGRFGDGLIWKIAYAKSHFMSEYVAVASPTTLMLIPSEGVEFSDAGPISLRDMEFNEMVSCMMPGDLETMMNVDSRETPVTAYSTIGILNRSYTAVPAGSKEVDDYISGSISAWLERVC